MGGRHHTVPDLHLQRYEGDPTGEPTTKITTSGKMLADAALAIGTIIPQAVRWVGGWRRQRPARYHHRDDQLHLQVALPPAAPTTKALTGSIELYHKSSGGGGGGGGSNKPSYAVTVDTTKNGTVTVSPKSAYKGDTVTITVKPDKGL